MLWCRSACTCAPIACFQPQRSLTPSPLTPPHTRAQLQALALPKDWAVLYHTHGLRSFLAVPIGTANETLGLLTVAKQQAHAFDDEWWVPLHA